MSTDAAIHETETATVVDAQTDVATSCTEDPPAPESSHDVLPVTEPHSSTLSDDDTFAGPASAAGGLAIDDSSAETRISFLERNIAAYEEVGTSFAICQLSVFCFFPISDLPAPCKLQEIKLMRERQLASHVQVSTMWELLRRMHDMVLVFDLQVRPVAVLLLPSMQRLEFSVFRALLRLCRLRVMRFSVIGPTSSLINHFLQCYLLNATRSLRHISNLQWFINKQGSCSPRSL
jgi:hypothetical protein